MRRRFVPALLLVPILALAGLALAACGGDDDDDGGGATSASPTRPAAAAASPTTAPAAAASPTSAAGGGANSVTMADFSYSPARFNARAGQALTLTVSNGGQFPHTFTIDNVVDSGSVSAGQSKTVTFTPAAAGMFTYYCTIHGAARMSGQLTVAGTTGSVPSDSAPAGGQSTSGSGGGSGSSDSNAAPTDYNY